MTDFRARAALAQPEPVAPTDEELIRPIMWMLDDSIYDNDKGEIAQSLRELVARWGAPAAVPTPEAKPTPSLKEPTPIETVCYYDDPENLPYFVGN
jgi:hypothetical protein